MKETQNLSGKIFGRLTVLGFSHRDRRSHNHWKCLCACGTMKVINGNNLRRGDVNSCGCYQKDFMTTHGESKTRLYSTWAKMKDRCTNSKLPRYKDYGGRGITMCDEWLNSYENFRDWALSDGKYRDDLTIDRIDNDKLERGYSPENCRFTTYKVQGNNKRYNRRILFNGEIKTASEWAGIIGIDTHTLLSRLDRYGWSVEKAFTEPIHVSEHPITYRGETKSLAEWKKITGLGDTLRSRLRDGWDVEKAMTTPLNINQSRKEERIFIFNGDHMTLKQLCAKYDKNYHTIQTRLNRGWSIDLSMTTPIKNNGVSRKKVVDTYGAQSYME